MKITVVEGWKLGRADCASNLLPHGGVVARASRKGVITLLTKVRARAPSGGGVQGHASSGNAEM